MSIVRVLVGSVSDLLLPNPAYLVVLLVLLCVRTFRRRGTKLRRYRYPMLAVALWSWILSTPGVANAVIGSLESRYPPVTDPPAARAPIILVLASGSMAKRGDDYEIRLDRASWARTFAGIQLWKKIGGKLLFVGGPTPDRKSSVAAYMGDIALASSVPKEAILVEHASGNTRENLLFNLDELTAHGNDVWVVTSAIHMRRAMGVARKLGLTPRPYPCDHHALTLGHWYAWIPNAGGPEMFGQALHELLGLAWYSLRGYTSRG